MDNLTLAKKRIASLKSNHDLINHSIIQDVQPIEVRPPAESARYVRIRQAAESSQSILVRQTTKSVQPILERTKERTHQEKVEIISKYHILKNGVQDSVMFPSQITPQMKVHEFFNILQMTTEQRNKEIDAMEKEIEKIERQKSLENEKNQRKLEMEREREQSQYIEREVLMKEITKRLSNDFERLNLHLFTKAYRIQTYLIQENYIFLIHMLPYDTNSYSFPIDRVSTLSGCIEIIGHIFGYTKGNEYIKSSLISKLHMFVTNLFFKYKKIDQILDPIERQKSKDFEKTVCLKIAQKEYTHFIKLYKKSKNKFENEVEQEVQRRLSRK